MAETHAADADIVEPARAEESSAPPKSRWSQLEASVLGIGSIVALLLIWELLPHLVTLSAGTTPI